MTLDRSLDPSRGRLHLLATRWGWWQPITLHALTALALATATSAIPLGLWIVLFQHDPKLLLVQLEDIAAPTMGVEDILQSVQALVVGLRLVGLRLVGLRLGRKKAVLVRQYHIQAPQSLTYFLQVAQAIAVPV